MSDYHERLALLDGELKKIDLPPYQKYKNKLEERDQLMLREDAKSFVESYLSRGYPSLGEAVSIVAPLIRHRLLKENGCWNEKDHRCIEYVEGPSTKLDVQAIKVLMEKERSERRNSLNKELQRFGMPVNVPPARDYEIETAIQDYIDEGAGQVDCLAFAISVLARIRELNTELRIQDISAPFQMSLHMICPGHKEQSIEDVRQAIKRTLPQRSQVAVQFILGDSMLGQTEVATKLKDEVSARRKTAEDLAREFQIDKSQERSRYIGAGRHIDAFIKDGSGDLKETLALFVFDQLLEENGLPRKNSIARATPSFNQRLDQVIVTGRRSKIETLVQELVIERQRRRDDVSDRLMRENESEYGDGCIGERQRHELETSDYVQLGGDPIVSSVERLRKNERQRRLQCALSQATPPLLSADLVKRMKSDVRLEVFVQGTSIFTNEAALVSTLQTEEQNRKSEVDGLLLDKEVDAESFFEWAGSRSGYRMPCGIWKYISEGVGSRNELLNEDIKGMKEHQLKEAFEVLDTDAFLARAFISEHPDCVDFIQGRGPTTCAHLVSLILQGKNERKLIIENIISDCVGVNSIDDLPYSLHSAVTDYVRYDKGDFDWLVQAIQGEARHKTAEDCFGPLKSMLPRLNFDDVTQWRQEIVDVAAKEIQSTLLELQGLSKESDDVGDCDLCASLSKTIISFYGPPFSDCMGYIMSGQDETIDPRIVLMLTCSNQSPWNDPVAAVAAIRTERKNRMEEFDGQFGGLVVSSPWPTSVFFRNYSPEEKLDRVWNEYDTRADYINGKITLEEATAKVGESVEKDRLEKRRDAFCSCLAAGGLHPRLASKHQECRDFIAGETPCEETNENLRLLLSNLRDKRDHRCQLLTKKFAHAGITDPGVGPSSHTDDLSIDSDEEEDGYNCQDFDYMYDNYDHYDRDEFPDKDYLSRKRFKYVDLGEGEPEDVTEMAIKVQRVEKLEDAIERAKLGLRCHASDWMRRSKRCVKFVSDTKSGYASTADVNEFITLLEQSRARQGGNGNTDQDNDDSKSDEASENSLENDYDPYDDDYCGGNDWKYHLSGGDYGNDPDTDAMWDSYWDC